MIEKLKEVTQELKQYVRDISPEGRDMVMFDTILDFLFSLPNAEMPKKVKVLPGSLLSPDSYTVGRKDGYNEALDDCLAYLAKREAELKQAQELYLTLSKDFADSKAEWQEKTGGYTIKAILDEEHYHIINTKLAQALSTYLRGEER